MPDVVSGNATLQRRESHPQRRRLQQRESGTASWSPIPATSASCKSQNPGAGTYVHAEYADPRQYRRSRLTWRLAVGNSVARTAALRSAGSLAVGAAAFAYGALVERNRFTVRQEHVPVLEPGHARSRVLHLSDLHMAPWQHRKQEWVRSLATLEPDLIVEHRRQPRPRRRHRGHRYALEPFRGMPGRLRQRLERLLRSAVQEPVAYFSGPSKHTPEAATARHGALRATTSTTLGWIDLNNAGARDRHRGLATRVLRRQRRRTAAGTGSTVCPALIDEMRENVGWQDDPSRPRSP